MEGLKDLTVSDRVTVDDLARRDVAQSMATQVVRAQITPEQLEHIAKTGELPMGVSEADLMALDPATLSQRHN